jgi:flavin reductase (DIM6/NTAB) family NADH-FMN oxidoreductase RutF
MGSFPSGVAVVTALDEQGLPRGLTTTAVTSVSLEPPLLLICVDRASRTLPAIRHAGSFAVNVIADGHANVASVFASKRDDKFAGIDWVRESSGSPILHHHATAWADCSIWQECEAGDHIVFLGEIVAAGIHPEERPSLVYLRQSFGRWLPSATSDSTDTAAVTSTLTSS